MKIFKSVHELKKQQRRSDSKTTFLNQTFKSEQIFTFKLYLTHDIIVATGYWLYILFLF